MTKQELQSQIAGKERLLQNPSFAESAKVAVKNQLTKLKEELEKLEQAEKAADEAKKAAEAAEKKAESTESKADEKKAEAAEKKAEAAEEKVEEIKEEIKEGLEGVEKKIKKAGRPKGSGKKIHEKPAKKKAAKPKKQKRKRRVTKVEAKAKKAAPKVEKKAPKRKKRATKKESITSFLAKNKVAKAKYKTVSSASKKRDADKPAKPFGYRLRGKGNYRRPTKEEIKAGKAYWEGRPTKADVRRTGYPKLEHGGTLDDKIIGDPNNSELLAGGDFFQDGGNVWSGSVGDVEGAGMFAKGGGIFGFGGDGRGNRTHHNKGRSWTADRAGYNKKEDYEIPMRKRAKRK